MIEVIPAKRRFSEDLGWLKTAWLFSFSHYYDPKNLEFGALRVFNDDVVMPGGGFPDHGHANFEIVTIVLEGEIAHKDSMGNETVVKAGEIQRMSAGRGVVHSEFNRSTAPVHLYQLWFHPRTQNLTPSYAQAEVLPQEAGAALSPLVSGLEAAPLSLSADASISMGYLKKRTKMALSLESVEGIFCYLEKGRLRVGNELLLPGDQARVREEKEIQLEAVEEVRFLLIRTNL
ncbi:pirin family protein [Candidatus Parcubacteria bacterium]|nr:pirin family protein [Candidatus Parcubacteria bacterium]